MVVSTESSTRLEKKIGLVNGVCLIVGNIIGSGIFLSPKGIQQNCGSVGLSLLMWIICGIFSFLGAMCYVELGTTITKSGASYAYILEAFGSFTAFVRIWASVFLIEPAVQASQAITFANYLIKPFFMSCEAPFLSVRLLAAVSILFICAMNCYSVRYGTRIQDWFSYGKILALVVIIITGFVSLAKGTGSNSLQNPWIGINYNVASWALALYSGLYAFAGWDTLNYMTEEIKDPFKNLPRAIYISMPICTLIYFLTSIAYYSVLTPNEMISSDAVAVTFGSKCLGTFQWIIPISVAMSCFGGLNASIMASSRLYYVGAREGHLPDYFAMISPDFCTPIPGILLSSILTLVYLLVEDVFTLINYFSICYWLAVTLSIFGQLWMRYTRPDMVRPIKFSLFYPISFSICCMFLVVTPFFSDTISALVGTAIIFSGFPIYYLFLYRKPSKIFFKISKFMTRHLQILIPVTKSSSFED